MKGAVPFVKPLHDKSVVQNWVIRLIIKPYL